MNDMNNIIKYQPHIETIVNSSGMLYVGRKYTGQYAHIYFLKSGDKMNNHIPELTFCDEEFIELQLIKNNSGLSWDRFVAECIRKYGVDKQ